jgi:hypothetical protein
VTVRYTGKPGVHNDGDGTTEGWFRSSDGGFVTTEPVGSEDWMPLNDHPTAKPTYDFYDTVAAGLTAVANGVLKSVTHHGPDARFTGGSATWHWHSRAPIASYLVENSVGHYTLTSRVGSDGIRYYQAQDASISAAQQQKNLAIMNQQTFFKEGMATLGEYLQAARDAETKAGGPGTTAGKKTFTGSLIAQFNKTYARAYGGGYITEPQLEAGFRHWLPDKSAACENRLGQFFTQWFDTAYPSDGGTSKPAITGPGLAGAGFYDASGGCSA